MRNNQWMLGAACLGLIGSWAGCNATRGGFRSSRDQSQVLDASAHSQAAATFPVRSTSEMNVVATIPSGGDWMCFGFGSLWEPSGGGIVRVDPASHTVVTTISASGNFCAPAPDSHTLWVASVYDGNLFRIDSDTNQVTGTFNVGEITSGSEGSFTVTAGGVWVITSRGNTQAGTLTRVDPIDGHVLADIKVVDGSAGVVAGGDFVWVSSPSGNSVTQVDPQTNAVVKTIAVDAGPRFITAGEGGVWTLCQGTGRVARIDPVSGALITHIDAKNPGGGGDIAAGEGGVWTTTFGKPVTHINPATNTVVEAFQGGGFGDAIRTGGGFVWVSGGELHQIKFDLSGGSGSGSGSGVGSGEGSSSGSDGAAVDPLAPPAGATAKSAKIKACGGFLACSHAAFSGQLGCAATDGATKFASMTGHNNSCDLIKVRAKICAAGLDSTKFTAACFKKN